jgi:multidrug efflux system membrane fusion protein
LRVCWLLRTGKLALVLAASSALTLGACGHSSEDATGGKKKGGKGSAVPVLVAEATARDVPITLDGIGTVVPLSVVEVKVRVDGQLDKVLFAEGQEVHAGELLAQIDPRPYEAILAQAQATRAKDQATLLNARLDVDRYGELIEGGGVSAQTLQAAKATVESLEATVHADEAAVDTAKLQKEFTRLVAPIDGRVGLRLINPGAIVHVTDASGIVTVTQMQPISVIFSMPQDKLPDILAASAKSKLAVIAFTRDGSKSLATGELSVIDSQVDSTTGQIRLRAAFANDNRTLWPGSLVSARLLVRTEQAVTVIPSPGVLRGQEGDFVYVVTKDNTVEARPVTTGESVDGYTAIAAGVELGEQVVVDGQARLAPGSHIDIKEEGDAARPHSGSAGHKHAAAG